MMQREIIQIYILSIILIVDRILRGAYDKFPDFFRMDTFIDSTHMKLLSPSK